MGMAMIDAISSIGITAGHARVHIIGVIAKIVPLATVERSGARHIPAR